MHLTILTVPLSNKNAIYKVYTVYTHSMSAWSLVPVMSDAQEIWQWPRMTAVAAGDSDEDDDNNDNTTVPPIIAGTDF